MTAVRARKPARIKAATAAGLQLVWREDVPPFLFLLVFGRATGR